MGQSTCEFMHDLYSWRLKWWGSRIGLRHALLQASIWRDMASLVLQDASVCLVTCLSLDWYTGKTCRMRKKKNQTDIFWLYSFIVLAWLAYLLLLSFPRLVVAVLKAINFLCYIYFFLLPLKEFKYVDLPGRVRVPSLTPPAAASYDLLSRGKKQFVGVCLCPKWHRRSWKKTSSISVPIAEPINKGSGVHWTTAISRCSGK